MSIDLRLGDWRDVLADVECDALICDPPYGARTHAAQAYGPGLSARGGTPVNRRRINYEHWQADDVSRFVQSWAPRTAGWVVALTSHDLVGAWQDALSKAGRYCFAPLPIVIKAMSVRLCGDGPSSWCVWLMVARPRTQQWSKWGTLPGAYIVNPAPRGSLHIGGKPLGLMRALVRDYSRPGDLVCDPCAGYGTTLRAAVAEGRRAVGAEIDPETHRKALGMPEPDAPQPRLL